MVEILNANFIDYLMTTGILETELQLVHHAVPHREGCRTIVKVVSGMLVQDIHSQSSHCILGFLPTART